MRRWRLRGCSLRLKGWRLRGEVQGKGVEVEGCSLRLNGWRLRGVV